MTMYENDNFDGRNRPQPVSGALSSREVDECRRLVASRYVDEGYVLQSELDENGFIDQSIDPYTNHSEYFWTLGEDERVEATVRIIRHPMDDDEWVFPLQKSFNLDAEHHNAINEFCRDYPERVVEISALAERKNANKFAAFDMFKRIWQHAKRSNYSVCLVSADERLDKKLKSLFGASIPQAGESKFVLGSMTVPSVLLPDECILATRDIYRKLLIEQDADAAEAYRQVIGYLVEGLEPQHFSDTERYHLVEMGINID